MNHSPVLDLFPPLTAEQYELASCAYRLLLSGAPVRREQLATEMNLPTREVVGLLERWPGHVAYDDWRRIIGLGGLSVETTPHRFGVNGSELYAWCAFDTMFLPELLDRPAEVQSDCPVTGESLRLHVSPEGVNEVSHPDAVLSLRVPGLAEIRDDVRANFCSYSNFFSSHAAATDWASQYRDLHILSLTDASELAQTLSNRQAVAS